MSHELLTQIGLSTEQAEIYLSLLENGAQSAAALAQNTSVKRTYVYRIAEELASKGLVNQGKKGRTTMFSPNSPDFLLNLVKDKQAQMSSAETQLESALPSLKEKYKAVDTRPVVQIYEGFEGIKKIYLDTLSVGEDIQAFVETSEMNVQVREWLKSHYIVERKRRNIHARVILASGKLAKDYYTRNKDGIRTVVEVPKTKYPIKHEIDIYGDKVAFINYRKNEPLVGFIVDHTQMAQTMRAWFELAWTGALKTKSS